MTFPEPVEKWLQALESGDYKQGRGTLTDVADDGTKRYCCLGVACELYAQEHPDEVVVVQESDYMIYKTSSARADANLLPEVASWLNTRDTAGDIDWTQVPEDDPSSHYQRADKHGTLAFMNDYGASFADIAAFIRRNPAAVFMETE